MSDQERDQHDTANEAADDAKEDLALKDEDADAVRGGAAGKFFDKGSTERAPSK